MRRTSRPSIRRLLDGSSISKEYRRGAQNDRKASSSDKLVSVLGLSMQLSCSRRVPRVAAELEFDATGNMVASSGPDGKKTSFHYDSRGSRLKLPLPMVPAAMATMLMAIAFGPATKLVPPSIITMLSIDSRQ
jgi:hypothetical protein